MFGFSKNPPMAWLCHWAAGLPWPNYPASCGSGVGWCWETWSPRYIHLLFRNHTGIPESQTEILFFFFNVRWVMCRCNEVCGRHISRKSVTTQSSHLWTTKGSDWNSWCVVAVLPWANNSAYNSPHSPSSWLDLVAVPEFFICCLNPLWKWKPWISPL